jgi:hypothetical protein
MRPSNPSICSPEVILPTPEVEFSLALDSEDTPTTSTPMSFYPNPAPTSSLSNPLTLAALPRFICQQQVRRLILHLPLPHVFWMGLPIPVSLNSAPTPSALDHLPSGSSFEQSLHPLLFTLQPSHPPLTTEAPSSHSQPQATLLSPILRFSMASPSEPTAFSGIWQLPQHGRRSPIFATVIFSNSMLPAPSPSSPWVLPKESERAKLIGALMAYSDPEIRYNPPFREAPSLSEQPSKLKQPIILA